MHDLVPAPSAEARRWAMLCHYAAFLGFVVPFIGNVIGPLVVWQFKREDDPFIDSQGKEALNFQLTVTLLHMICWLLVWVLIGFPLMLLVAWVFLRFRAGGRNLYAMGGSAEVARLSGIKVRTITIWIYALSGALAGLAAVAMAARLDSSQPSAGLSMELDAIAAVVIGGASLSGGVGSVGGTLVGVLIIGVLRNGLNLLGVSPFVQQVIIGIVIALAVTLFSIFTLRPVARRLGLVDKPGGRKAHKGRVPLIGGLCFFLGTVAAPAISVVAEIPAR